MNYANYYDSPLGKLFIMEKQGRITAIAFGESKIEAYRGNSVLQETALIKFAQQQLTEYFNNKRTEFELPLEPEGTDFQKTVWKELRNIPYGETRTYKQIAETLSRPKGFQAVGQANAKNPISIVVPCHRVIGSNKQLVGYAGGLDRKKELLDLEFNHPKILSIHP